MQKPFEAPRLLSLEGDKEICLPHCYPQLLSDFAKEVIRIQPKDIYQFGEEYFNLKRMGLPLKKPEGGYAAEAVKEFRV